MAVGQGVSFAEFAVRKTAEAAEAVLPPYVTDLERPTRGAIRVGNDWSRGVFDGDFYMSPAPGLFRPSCNLVFVESLDGNTGAANPGDLGGGETDKHAVYEGLSRVTADAVMAGAGTIRDADMIFSVWHPALVSLRAEHGKPRHPIQVVATLRGVDLTRGMMFNTASIRVVLITLQSWAEAARSDLARRPWIQAIAMDDRGELPEAFRRLREMGVERVSCVGGRHFARQLLDAALVDDLYLTTSARPGGEADTPLFPGPLPAHQHVVRKHGTGADRGVVFNHYALETTGSAAEVPGAHE